MSNQETFQDAEIINDDFSPLDAPVKQRAYTQHKVEHHRFNVLQ